VDLTHVRAAAEDQEATGVIGHIPDGLKTVAAQFWINVTNTGSAPGKQVVGLFFARPVSALVRGHLALLAFGTTEKKVACRARPLVLGTPVRDQKYKVQQTPRGQFIPGVY
jgi:hypothetical protein